jgi:hypothetical protein
MKGEMACARLPDPGIDSFRLTAQEHTDLACIQVACLGLHQTFP